MTGTTTPTLACSYPSTFPPTPHFLLPLAPLQNELPVLSDWDKHCIAELGSEFEIDFINVSYCRCVQVSQIAGVEVRGWGQGLRSVLEIAGGQGQQGQGQESKGPGQEGRGHACGGRTFTCRFHRQKSMTQGRLPCALVPLPSHTSPPFFVCTCRRTCVMCTKQHPPPLPPLPYLHLLFPLSLS